MTVLCLIEQADGGGVAEVSLRALTFARALAESWMYHPTAQRPSIGTFIQRSPTPPTHGAAAEPGAERSAVAGS